MPQQILRSLRKIVHIFYSQLVVPFITKPTAERWRDCGAKDVGGVACKDLESSIVVGLQLAACSLPPQPQTSPHLWLWTTLDFTNIYVGVSHTFLKLPE